MYRRLIYLIIISLLMLSNTGQADLQITNGTFDGGTSGGTDVPGWYDLNTNQNGTTDWWNTASICDGPNPFPNGSAMLGDDYPPTGLAGRYIYQAIGTRSSSYNYSISIDFAQPTDGNINRSTSIKVEIYQGSFPGAADDVDIAGKGLTLIDSVSSPSFPDMAIHNFTSPLNLSSANTTDMLWIRISNLPGTGTDLGSWIVIDNVQIISATYGIATKPHPANNSTDILQNTVLSWTPGEVANTHNLFIGTNFDDVNNATVTNPLSTIYIEALDVNNYDPPGRLEFGTTYYWRVDEVNAPSKPGQYKGDTWQFTVEPIALQIQPDNITVTAISSYINNDPNNTINESGLDPNNMDLHSDSIAAMWLSSGTDVNSVWIRYDLDKIYKLYQMLVWNFNSSFLKDSGFKQVVIEYSQDGQAWTQLANVPEFAKATGISGYEYNTVIDFNGLAASSIRLTCLKNWSTLIPFPYSGLSEVRFMYIPIRAREPYPENEVSDLFPDISLSWRAGRDAEQHYLYLSTDMNSVAQNIVSPFILYDANYVPALTLGQTYYWKVDEVNMAEAYTTWDGPVWSFSTVDSIVVENFEVGYDDTDANAVWVTWTGYLDPTNGGSMGNPGVPYLSTINRNGGHSAPMYYDNTGTVKPGAAKSEVIAQVLDLPIATTNWTVGSPTTLVLWIYGNIANNAAIDRLYVKIGSAKVLFTGNISQPRWMQMNIPLSTAGINLSNVSSITIGVEKIGATGGTGSVLLDDIRLYHVAPAISTEQYWIEAESGTITTPFEKFSLLVGASGSQYIGKADGAGNNTSPITDGSAMATYNFTVSGGIYMIDMRWQGIGTSDAFWIQITPTPVSIKTIGGQDVILTSGWLNDNNMRPRAADWHWSYARSDSNPTGDVRFTLPAGTYTLKIANRDDGTMLDAFVIMKVD